MTRMPGIGPSRPSTPVFGIIAGLLFLMAAALAHAALTGPAQRMRMANSADLVRALGLTDLALFTEARYTRHPAMADLHTAFQDHPMSFEHFPSGIFVPPPSGFGTGTLSFGQKEAAQ